MKRSKDCIFLYFAVLLFATFPFFRGYSDSRCSISSPPPQSKECPRKFIHKGTLKDEVVVGPYTIRTYRDPNDGGSFEILKSQKRVWGQHGWAFQIGDRGDTYGHSCFDLAGGDLTGDGNPNIVIYEWSGGAHCCFTMQLFDISEEFRLMTKIDGGDSVPQFVDWDNDNIPEIELLDMSYAYFPGCFASSPTPTVVFKYSNRSHVLAMDQMSKPITDKDEYLKKFQKHAQEVKNDEIWTSGPDGNYSHYHIPSDLFSHALDLMYGGNEDYGWKFIHEAWTDGFPVDEELLDKFREKMNASSYWRDLKEEYQKTKQKNINGLK